MLANKLVVYLHNIIGYCDSFASSSLSSLSLQHYVIISRNSGKSCWFCSGSYVITFLRRGVYSCCTSVSQEQKTFTTAFITSNEFICVGLPLLLFSISPLLATSYRKYNDEAMSGSLYLLMCILISSSLKSLNIV